jgi:hypothetical protein
MNEWSTFRKANQNALASQLHFLLAEIPPVAIFEAIPENERNSISFYLMKGTRTRISDPIILSEANG